LKSLYREKDRLNSYENQIPIDYACGWALSSDNMSCTMQMLLDDADANMYKNKQLCKEYIGRRIKTNSIKGITI